MGKGRTLRQAMRSRLIPIRGKPRLRAKTPPQVLAEAQAKFTENVNQLTSQRTVSPLVAAAVFELLNWSQKNAAEVTFGSAQSGSFLFRVQAEDRIVTLFSCSGLGHIEIFLRNIQSSVSPTAYHAFLTEVSHIPGAEDVLRHRAPIIMMESTLVNPLLMKTFQGAVMKLQAALAS